MVDVAHLSIDSTESLLAKGVELLCISSELASIANGEIGNIAAETEEAWKAEQKKISKI